jgi:uncharacterized protein DUF2474
MALIWAGGVIGLAIVAALLRLLMGLAGLTGHRIDALSAQISISMRQPLGIVPISASVPRGSAAQHSNNSNK